MKNSLICRLLLVVIIQLLKAVPRRVVVPLAMRFNPYLPKRLLRSTIFGGWVCLTIGPLAWPEHPPHALTGSGFHPNAGWTADTTTRPAENRFSREVITDHLDEPMELAVAPSGMTLFIDRTGAMRRYDPAPGRVRKINAFPVRHDEGENIGYGLLGLTLDPDFERNRHLYVFYTPRNEPLRHQISRFTLGADSVDYASEKVLLTIPIEAEPGAHTGGSLAFDSRGNLFIGVGDNTDPSQSDGFAPHDERPGRLIYDAQRSAGNTHDLRGKILRLHVEADGRVTIPDGNLFPKDGSAGRPEIYVMGCRNPYRLTVDGTTLFWGEIGPDSGVDGPQGPRGYDEFNRAEAPGNYGWPYFVGDNKPYHAYDFATKAVGSLFDATAPVNHSIHNTGAKTLPPAHGALIWYPYNESAEFPVLKNGGRSAMAGAVYHYDANLKSDVKFPAYYDGALFVFDWMRNWIMAVFFDPQGRVQRIERIMASTKIDKPIDMQFAPDGALMVLEYGENYGQNNPDASLVRLTFNPNNRPPVVVTSRSDSVGQPPLAVQFSGRNSYDPDGDSLTYRWTIDGTGFVSNRPDARFTFRKPGVYRAVLTVADPKGAKSSHATTLSVGNSQPVVRVVSPDNRSFYWDNEPFRYRVVVTDREDKLIDPKRVAVYFDYLAQGKDVPRVMMGHQKLPPAGRNRGQELVAQSDCRSCHILDKRAVGPSFLEIAARYQAERPLERLAGKIIAGGSGVWGPHAMSAHPQLSPDQATRMVEYILSLADAKKEAKALPTQGTIRLDQHLGKKEKGTYLLAASYTDRGGRVVGPLTTRYLLTLRPPTLQAEDADAVYKAKQFPSETGVGFYVGEIHDGSYLLFRGIDLAKIESLTYKFASLNRSGTIELHLDSPTGPVVSTSAFGPTQNWITWAEQTAPVNPTTGLHDLYVVFSQPTKPNDNLLSVDWIRFNRAE